MKGPFSELVVVLSIYWDAILGRSMRRSIFDENHFHHFSIVTAACPYPALRLDKLYAALIRCLVLWTVTKQILVFLFKGLYLLA